MDCDKITMAIAKLPYALFKDSETYEVFYNYFSKVSIIKKDNLKQIVTFRVQGEGIPIDDRSIILNLYRFPGIRPFVIEVKIFV